LNVRRELPSPDMLHNSTAYTRAGAPCRSSRRCSHSPGVSGNSGTARSVRYLTAPVKFKDTAAAAQRDG
jgi:hypothetical protein